MPAISTNALFCANQLLKAHPPTSPASPPTVTARSNVKSILSPEVFLVFSTPLMIPRGKPKKRR